MLASSGSFYLILLIAVANVRKEAETLGYNNIRIFSKALIDPGRMADGKLLF